MKPVWHNFVDNFDRMVPGLTVALYSIVYSIAAIFRVPEIEEAITPHTSVAIVFSVVIIANTAMMAIGGYFGLPRLISWGSLVFFCIWTSTAAIYIQTGAWYYLFTITTVPIFLSVYISMRTNTWLFNKNKS